MILELGTGEALVSFLNEDGQPEIAERAAREAEKAAEREAKAREKQTQDVIKNIGKIATSFLGAFGRDAAKKITRGLFGTRRR